MSEDMSNSPEEQTAKTLVDSRLYELTRHHNLLTFLVPEPHIQVQTALEITEKFPKEPTDVDKTRILVQYTNTMSNQLITKITSDTGLSSSFDIDTFLNGLGIALNVHETQQDPIMQINLILASALESAINVALGFGDRASTERHKNMALEVLVAIVAIVFNNPEDIFISIRDKPNCPGEVAVTGIVVVTERGLQTVSSTVH